MGPALWHCPLGSPVPPAKGAAQGSQGRDFQGESCPSPRGFSGELLSSAGLAPRRAVGEAADPPTPPPQSRAGLGERPSAAGRPRYNSGHGPGAASEPDDHWEPTPRPGRGAAEDASGHGRPRCSCLRVSSSPSAPRPVGDAEWRDGMAPSREAATSHVRSGGDARGDQHARPPKMLRSGGRLAVAPALSSGHAPPQTPRGAFQVHLVRRCTANLKFCSRLQRLFFPCGARRVTPKPHAPRCRFNACASGRLPQQVSSKRGGNLFLWLNFLPSKTGMTPPLM